MQLRISALTAAFAVLLAQAACAKPRSVELKSELDNASVVAEVTILQYMDDRLWIQSIQDTAVRAEVRYSDYPQWNPKQFIQADWKNQKNRTGVWPSVGSTLVVVLDGSKTVSLFAEPVLGDWRFWSPQMTGSVALFECAPPARVIEPMPAKGAFYKNKSWDGCLLPSSSIPWKALKQ